jgi:two-component system cell cycle sensor histidine kinase/response regulator CckA
MSAVPPAPPSELEIVHAVADSLPVGVWVARAPSGEFVYANRCFSEIMGMAARDDVAAGGYAEPYGIFGRDGEHYPEDRMPFAQALRARATIEVDDLVIHRGDGRRVHVRAFARPIFAGDVITHVVIAFIDITREVEAEVGRAESEARLIRSQRMESIGTLAGGIAHDFNNLLTVLKLVAAQLSAGERDAQRRGSLAIIEEITERASALTRSLLGFARRGKHRSQPMALNRVVGSLAEIIRRALGQGNGIEVQLETGAREGGWVVGDFSQIEQVIMNLVVNARDAMADLPGPRALTVRTLDVQVAAPRAAAHGEIRPGRYVCVEVIDQGRGIPVELRERIFEPYFTTKLQGPTPGTGLGLATVYGIVEGHGGAIEVEPGPDGRGTLMRVLLPAAEPAEDRDATSPAAARAPERGSGTILVVDDDPMVRASLAGALVDLGYQVIESHDGARAVEVFRERHGEISAVLLDLIMPTMGGRDCYRAMSEIDRGIPVVLMTGHAMNDEVQTLLGLGVAGFLAKPCSLDDLSVTVASVLSS